MSDEKFENCFETETLMEEFRIQKASRYQKRRISSFLFFISADGNSQLGLQAIDEQDRK